MAAVLTIDHNEARVEERAVWNVFQLSRQKMKIVRFRGNSRGSSDKWSDGGSILKVGTENFLIQ